jgi:hypothetical protein
MSMRDRAAQFAPFSALTGYGDVVDETARLTDGRIVLTEDAKALLDFKQRLLQERIDTKPEITITYFVKDARKSGGSYQTVRGRLLRIDDVERTLVLEGGRRINAQDVIDIAE